jgi:hypothetical protein
MLEAAGVNMTEFDTGDHQDWFIPEGTTYEEPHFNYPVEELPEIPEQP